jgi:hypothetical protein
VNRVRQFWHYVRKVYDLPNRLRNVRNNRPEAQIPTAVLTLGLFLGAILRLPSFLQLESHTKRCGWQRLVQWTKWISDDAFVYALERYDLGDLRGVLQSTAATLKRNKNLESARIHGLLVLTIDANEQFKSRSRCCQSCCQRQIECKDAQGQLVKVTEYYHRQVYGQIHGPDLSVILDLEPIGPGEDETQAALRMLERIRQEYGPRFFDVVAADAWYAQGPFIKAVQRLGWGIVVVLKQQRYEIYQEASALSRKEKSQVWQEQGRQIELWEVKDLPFTDKQIGSMRVVLAEESWKQKRRVGGQTVVQDQQSHWRWLADSSLDPYPAKVIWQIGHQRWGIENHAFNELTQHYHLEHCPHHEPVAIVAWLLLLVLAFNMFEFFVRLNGKLWRQGRITMQEISQQLDRALEQVEELEPLWSG